MLPPLLLPAVVAVGCEFFDWAALSWMFVALVRCLPSRSIKSPWWWASAPSCEPLAPVSIISSSLLLARAALFSRFFYFMILSELSAAFCFPEGVFCKSPGRPGAPPPMSPSCACVLCDCGARIISWSMNTFCRFGRPGIGI